MLIGHVGLALLAQKGFDTAPIATMAGALFPDVVDKGLCEGLHITESGRQWAHSLFVLGTSTLLVRLIAGKRQSRSWAIGYISHLLGDATGQVPVLYPFKSYTFNPPQGFWENINRFLHNPGNLLFESSLVLVAVAISLRG